MGVLVLLAISWIALALTALKLYVKLTTGMCNSQVYLVGKTAIITGANTGIGYETAIDFAKRGARVILACRSESRAQEAVDKIKKETHNHNVLYKLVDFSSFSSVRKFATDINATEPRLDILVNNAAATFLGDTRTEDGLPMAIQINYFSQFLLTLLLLDLLKKTQSRVVNVSATGATLGKIDFDKLTTFQGDSDQYFTSKLCQILFTTEFARRFANTNVTTYSLHPGVIETEIFRKMPGWKRVLILFIIRNFYKTATEGAQTQIYCSVANGLESQNGKHFHDCHLVKSYKNATDPDLARRVWEESERIVNLKS